MSRSKSASKRAKKGFHDGFLSECRTTRHARLSDSRIVPIGYASQATNQHDHKPPTEAVFLFPGATVTVQDDMKSDIAENEQRIAVHEAVCAERYQGIQESFNRGEKRMQRIEKRSARVEYVIYFLIIAVLIGPANAVKLFEVVFK